MQSVRDMMSHAQLQLELTRDIKLLLWSCADRAAEAATSIGAWIQKEDGRKRNSGASHRKERTPAFKVRVISDYERYTASHPSHKGEMADIVADLYDVHPNQVRAWVRKKDELVALGKSRAKGKRSRKRQRKGRFQKAEEQP